jgi:hypothetical protein
MKYFILLIPVLCLQLQSQTFTDVAAQTGINHVYNYAFNGAGISFCDYDNDGNDDILIPSYAGEKVAIYKNNNAQFQYMTNQYNINSMYESKSIIAVDYDNDGDRDIFITNIKGKLKLYRNDGGNYTDVTVSAGLTNDSVNATAAIWFDYNRDGLLDLYVGIYSGYLTNTLYPNRMYKNMGNGQFQDVTASTNTANTGNKVLALTVIDYNNDNWPDIYIASDRRVGNAMLRNNGNGTFTNTSVQTGTYYELDAMGLSAGDYNNDGYFDLYISNGQEGNVFLKNNGNGTFSNVAVTLGMTINKICWGNNFFDYDNDGDLDLFVCASGGSPNRSNELWKNNGNGTFTKVTNAGFNDDFQSYGNAIGDFDNNGYYDIATLNEGDNISLWKSSGGTNNWIKIKLQGVYSNREGIGSQITVYRNGQSFTRYVNCGQSYCSENSLTQLYGAGTVNTIDSIKVYWPSSAINMIRNINVNQTITIIESWPIGINNNQSGVIKGYALKQNYPNPFNPTTNIEYQIPGYSFVNLVLYDISGKEITKLISEYKNAGTYTYNLSGEVTDNLSSGTYFYKLTAGQFTDTKKLLLIK